MPWRSQLLLYVVVFCSVAPIGVLPKIVLLGAVPVPYLILDALAWGCLGVVGVFASLRSAKLIPIVFAGSALVALTLTRWPAFQAPTSLDAAGIAAARTNLTVIMAMTVAGIMIAYRAVFFLITREGSRYWAAHAEIELAHGIHRALVPTVEGSCPPLAWRGISQPSGEVGGDLVDVITPADGSWVGLVADVSGHGVAAGLLMGMLKTAVHGAVDTAPTAGALATRVNAVLGPLSEPNMFVTAVLLHYVKGRTLEFVLAGHPPLLWWHAREQRVDWVGDPQLALCVMPEARYESQSLTVAPGDLVVAVTDGLLEVFDRADRELGRVGIAHALDGLTAGAPLAEVERRLFEACRRHGKQTDDQTVLAIRVGPGGN